MEFYHHGIKGMKWGVRRYQNEDGSLTAAGRKRYDLRTLNSWARKTREVGAKGGPEKTRQEKQLEKHYGINPNLGKRKLPGVIKNISATGDSRMQRMAESRGKKDGIREKTRLEKQQEKHYGINPNLGGIRHRFLLETQIEKLPTTLVNKGKKAVEKAIPVDTTVAELLIDKSPYHLPTRSKNS